jgi:hypothetical protein
MEIAGVMKFSKPSVTYSGKSICQAEIIIFEIELVKLQNYYNARNESSEIQDYNQ